MANIERITCDYAGCDKEYAYRVNGFNLCSRHLPASQLFTNRAVLLEVLKRMKDAIHDPPNEATEVTETA